MGNDIVTLVRLRLRVGAFYIYTKQSLPQISTELTSVRVNFPFIISGEISEKTLSNRCFSGMFSFILTRFCRCHNYIDKTDF